MQLRISIGAMFPVVALLSALAVAPAAARELAFTAELSGKTPSSMTGSAATAHAKILVDTDAQTVDVAVAVEGIRVDDLWTKLRNSPKGPIHLHIYESRDRNGSAELIFPLPYGATYTPTAKGFTVDLKGAPYAAGAKLVQSTVPFAEFVSALQAGRLVLNVHTNADPNGEISGDVVPVAR